MPVEGAFYYAPGPYQQYRFGTLNAGPQGSIRAGAGGAIIGRFAWVSPDGVALNERTSDADLIGFVLPEVAPLIDWRRVFFDETLGVWRIRQGLNISLLADGAVWARFPFGAYAGQDVYANPLDGTPISGYSVGAELTRWKVNSNTAPGGLAIITTWSKTAS